MLEQIKELHSRGLTNRKIAQTIGCHHKTIGTKLKSIGLLPNGNGPTSLKYSTSPNYAICSKCDMEYPVEMFQYSHSNKGRLSYCNNCRNKQTTDRINGTLESFLLHRFQQLKSSAKKRNIKFDLDIEHIRSLYNLQKGRCFYTGIPMDIEIGKGYNPISLSFYKVFPGEGYIKGNVVLCINKVNTCKSNVSFEEMKLWMPGWYERVKMWVTSNEL